jgi:NAD/NADP transhydrogenase beta subunit
VWKARNVVVVIAVHGVGVCRSARTAALSTRRNSLMLFGDAKERVEDIIKAL